jgi:meiotically up-regulated gene 157 (Mug157) protein
MPFNFSSQLNVWRVLTRLAALNLVDSYTPAQLQSMAGQLKQDLYRHMAAPHQGRPLFAYLTDLAGNYQFYHDANDWPTILAPAWGFCDQSDPIWLNTLDFAFSPANSGGYYPGRLGGLGSVHSPHPWPLGAIQELYLSRLFQDKPRFAATWARLLKIACWDGNFAEAIDEDSGQVASRHWFGWPGAMLAMVLLS